MDTSILPARHVKLFPRNGGAAASKERAGSARTGCTLTPVSELARPESMALARRRACRIAGDVVAGRALFSMAEAVGLHARCRARG